MATVGGYTCNFVRGTFRALKARGEVWQTPGVNGYGAHVLGTGDADWVCTAVRYETAANVETWLRTIEALQYSTITIVDDYGVTYTNLMVTRVESMQKEAAVGSGHDTRGEITLSGVKLG